MRHYASAVLYGLTFFVFSNNLFCGEANDQEYINKLWEQITWDYGTPDPDKTEFESLDIKRVKSSANSKTLAIQMSAIDVLAAIKEPSQLDELVAIALNVNPILWNGNNPMGLALAAQVRNAEDEKKLESLMSDERMRHLGWALRNSSNKEYIEKILNPKLGSSEFTSSGTLNFIHYRLKHSLPMDPVRVEAFLKNACLRGVYDSAAYECAKVAVQLKHKWVISWLVAKVVHVREFKKTYSNYEPFDYLYWNEVMIQFELATGEKIGTIGGKLEREALDDETKKKIEAAVAKMQKWWEQNKANKAYQLK